MTVYKHWRTKNNKHYNKRAQTGKTCTYVATYTCKYLFKNIVRLLRQHAGKGIGSLTRSKFIESSSGPIVAIITLDTHEQCWRKLKTDLDYATKLNNILVKRIRLKCFFPESTLLICYLIFILYLYPFVEIRLIISCALYACAQRDDIMQ